MAYSAVHARKIENDFFLFDSGSEESSKDVGFHFLPQLKTVKLSSSNLSGRGFFAESLKPISWCANLNPHGWSVPIFMDDCIYRI